MKIRDLFRFGHVAIWGYTAVLPLTAPLIRWAIILAFTLPLLTADWLVEQDWQPFRSTIR